MSYFRGFPTYDHTYTFNGQMFTIPVADLMVRFKFQQYIDSVGPILYNYTWKDSDRPDVIASWYYKNPQLFWLIYYANGAFDLYMDFPKSNVDFDAFLISKYGNNEQIQIDVHHYESVPDGLTIDYDTYLTLQASQRKIVTIYEYEFQQNERNRVIKLLDNDQAGSALEQLRRELKFIKAG